MPCTGQRARGTECILRPTWIGAPPMPHPPDANPERTGNCHVSAAFFSCIRLIRASRGPDMPICGAANMRAGVIGFYLLVCPLGGIVLSGCWPYSALATPDVHMRVVE